MYRIDPATEKVKDTINIVDLGTGFWKRHSSAWRQHVGHEPELKGDRKDRSDDQHRSCQLTHVPYAPQNLVVGFGSVWVTLTANPN